MCDNIDSDCEEKWEEDGECLDRHEQETNHYKEEQLNLELMELTVQKEKLDIEQVNINIEVNKESKKDIIHERLRRAIEVSSIALTRVNDNDPDGLSDLYKKIIKAAGLELLSNI